MSGNTKFVSSWKFLILYFLLVPILIFAACWDNTRAPHEMVAFSFSEKTPEIYLGSFFNKSKDNLLSFSGKEQEVTQGALSVTREGQPLNPTFDKQITSSSHFRIYEVKSGDQICLDKNCHPAKDELKVAALTEGNETYLTTVSAKIPTSDLPVSKSIFIHSAKSIDIFVADLTVNQVKKFSLNNNVAKPINFYKADGGPRLLSSEIMLVFSALFWSILFYICICVIAKNYKKIDIYGGIILFVVLFQYFVLFPGIFTSDMIVNDVGSGRYVLSYSSLYMLLNIFVGLFNFKAIQLPVVILFLMAFFAIIASIKNEKIKKIYYLITALLIVFCPIFYAVLFVSQRLYYPPLLIILSIYFFVRSLSANKGQYYDITYSMLFAGAAFMLKSEYIIFILAYFIVFYLYHGVIRYKKIRVCAATIVGLLISYFCVGAIIPMLYGVDSRYEKLRQQNISLLDIAQPYVPCPGSSMEKNPIKASAYIVKGVELSGGLKAYCDSGNPESFVWTAAKGMWMPVDVQAEINENLKKGYLISLTVLPQPAIERFKDRGLAIMNRSVWQLVDQYATRDTDNGFHPANADRMNLVLDRPPFKSLTQYVMRVANMFNGQINYWNWLAVLLVVFVYPVILYRTKATFTLNIAVIVYGVVSIFLSPAVNWAYIVMIPIWALFAIPLALMERDWLKEAVINDSDGEQ